MDQSLWVWLVEKYTVRIHLSFRLPDTCSVFQAKVADIKVAVDLLLRSPAFILDFSRELADRTLETSERCKK